MTKKEVYNINFLKFVFAICICLWHVFAGLSSVDYFKLIPLYVPDAGILTNYYFIISGFFLYSSVVKENNTVAFVKNKIVRLWGPVFFFSTAMLILSSYNICNWNFNDFITCLFFINNIGFTEKYGAVAWFVSDLFFASLFYYFILKIVNHDLFKKVLWIALILIGSYIYFKYKNFKYVLTPDLFVPVGLLRALLFIGVGLYVNLVKSDVLELKIIKNKGDFFYTFLTILILFFIFYCSNLKNIDKFNEILFYIAFIVLLLIFYGHLGKISKALEFKSNFFKYSYSLYLTHYFVKYIIGASFWYSTGLVRTNVVFSSIICLFLLFFFTKICFDLTEKKRN